MNKDNAKDYLPLVQALADGKVIQWGDHYGVWVDMEQLSDQWPADHYRIKPEPREIWVNRHIDGRNSSSAYESKAGAERGMIDGWRSVRYREVIE